jgi:hypothetical protein
MTSRKVAEHVETGRSKKFHSTDGKLQRKSSHGWGEEVIPEHVSFGKLQRRIASKQSAKMSSRRGAMV